ncbi:MAG: hypothetical protein V4594_09555 [Bacteroidota bacterium]
MKTYFLLLFTILYFFQPAYTQKKRTQSLSARSIREVALKHRQISPNSCIPMSIEMILMFNKKAATDYYQLQRNWNNRADGTFNDFDNKVIAGLKFRRQFAMPRGDKFPYSQLFSVIDRELASGRKVVISLPSGDLLWHMYVIDSKTSKGEYLAYSRGFNLDKVMVLSDVKSRVYGCKGTDILTYN